jgi:acetate kinase
MRELHASKEPAAQLAIDVFVHAARKGIAAMAASMGGIDLLVFTGGIGEHDHLVRDAIVGGLHWAGIGPTHMAVVPTGEDAQIALHAARLAFA